MNRKIMAMVLAAIFIIPSCAIVITPVDEAYAAGETWVVETSPDFAPYDYLYGEEYTGIDMDILREVANRLGVNIKFANNNFDSIITSVQQGKCTFGASGFTINDDREAMIDFSIPYSSIHQVVVASIDANITSEDDVRGKKISVQIGTSGADYAETLSSNIVYQKGYSEVVLDLLYGKAFCEVVDDAVAYAQVAAHPDKLKVYKVLNAPVEEYGFVFNEADDDLRTAVDGALESMKKDGTLDAIHQYYADNNFSIDTPSYFSSEKFIFAFSDDNGPYTYSMDDGYAGIEADVLSALVSNMGYKLRINNIAESNIQSKVLTYDKYLGASAYTTTASLKPGLAVTDAYTTEKLVVVHNGSDTVTSLDDIEGKKIAVMKDCAGIDYLEQNGVVSVVEFDSVDSALQSVITGNMDYAVMDLATAMYTISKYSYTMNTADVLEGAPETGIGFIVNADQTELIAALNTAIAALKQDGTINAIVQHYADNAYSASTHSYYYDDSEPSWWDKLVDRFERNFLENDRYKLLFTGLGNTLKITVAALVIGLIIGLLLAAVLSVNAQTGRLWPLALLAKGYVTVIRGTPVMVQLLIIYYVVFATSSLSPVIVASAAFGINSGAYIAEIIRSGMNSVPKGQMEAARCLGLSTGSSMKSVVVPQAVRNILPALGNESIALLKETSIAGFIGVIDLTRGADIIRGQTYDALMPLLVVALIYLAIVLILQFLVKKMERRLNNAY